MSALTEALAAVQRGTGCPRCLVGRSDLMADPHFRCEVCHGTGVPHFVLLSAAEAMLAALTALVYATEDNDNPSDQGVGSDDDVMVAARKALKKAEGRS